jgi:putative adenylate-forming enzyme
VNALLPFRVLAARNGLERHCRWDRKRLEAYQARSVERLRRFVCERSPFYRRLHAGMSLRPFSELPIVTKAMLMENFDELVTDPGLRLRDVEEFLRVGPGSVARAGAGARELFRGRYVALATSGSTGRRGVFVFNEREWIEALASITRPMGWAGIRPRLLRPRRMAIAASTVPWHYSAAVGRYLSSRFMPTLRLDATESLEEIVARLNAWRPEVLAVYPSLLRQLADEQISGRLRIPLRDVATSAEVLTGETRRRVCTAWGIRVYDTYGATEYAPIAAECAEGNKHLVEDAALIEIVDEHGREVPPGGDGDRILLTMFRRFTQPLVRYEISDMVRPRGGVACACGRPFLMIEAVEGRREDVLYFASSDSAAGAVGAAGVVGVHPNVFHELLEPLPASGWQVLQQDDGLHVGLTGLASGSVVCSELERALRDRLSSRGVVVPSIRVERVEALVRGPTGKAPLVTRVHDRGLLQREPAVSVTRE